ncbi:hypothetical protein EDB89DRAFT_2075646 [Lactarius sanguifluus]|nr:hypothetical protein EDB89DRAFT_2075646 [Lactarius sanguifluus]
MCLSWNSSYPINRKTPGTNHATTSPIPLLPHSSSPLHTALLYTDRGTKVVPVASPSSRPPPPFAQTDAQEGQYAPASLAPSARATPAQPHAPRPCLRTQEGGWRAHPGRFSTGDASLAHAPRRAPARARSRREGAPTPVASARATPAQPTRPAPPLPARARGGDGAHPNPFSKGDATRPSLPLPAHATGGTARHPGRFSTGDASPAHAPRPCPHTQQKGRRATPGPSARATPAQPTRPAPPLPAHATEGTARHPGPFSTGDASPADASRFALARARNRRDGAPTPVPSARATPAQPTRPAPPLPARAIGGTARPPRSPQRGRRQPSPTHPGPTRAPQRRDGTSTPSPQHG